MSLDPTARESNVRDSFKKHMVDNIKRVEGIDITFDKGLNSPNIQGIAVDQWVAVLFGEMDPNSNVQVYDIRIVCCTRKDTEGYRLTQLRDKVMGYLTDSTLGTKRIHLYRTNVTPWTLIGAMMVFFDPESRQMESDDGTKYKILNIRLKWGAII